MIESTGIGHKMKAQFWRDMEVHAKPIQISQSFPISQFWTQVISSFSYRLNFPFLFSLLNHKSKITLIQLYRNMLDFRLFIQEATKLICELIV